MKISTLNITEAEGTLIHPALTHISMGLLRRTVESLAYPRHYVANRTANERARDWLIDELRSFGYTVSCQGEYDNVIAHQPAISPTPSILIGAHYDTVPTTPGADDNNSAIAVCLETARVVSAYSEAPLIIAIFNREEDGLLGSSEYVKSLGPSIHDVISEAHIFEMIGYYSDAPNSQSKPANLPIALPDTGNFIGILSNSSSNTIAKRIFESTKRIGSETPVVSLKTFLGLEKVFGDLLRSDHTPFWQEKVPALMWTDTSEYRNPHYHAPTDVPETLNYHSLLDVTRMIVAHILS